MDSELVQGLRLHGLDVQTSAEAGMLARSDEEHLVFASDQQRALCSFNIRHSHALHTEWMKSGRTHWGLILWRQKHYSVRERSGSFFGLRQHWAVRK
jgi:hypothetical protein